MSLPIAVRASRICCWARSLASATAVRTGFLGGLAADFLRLEDHQAGFAQALLVILGLGFCGGNVGAGLNHCTFGTLTTLVQRLAKRIADQGRVDGIEQQEDHHGRDRAEQ